MRKIDIISIINKNSIIIILYKKILKNFVELIGLL